MAHAEPRLSIALLACAWGLTESAPALAAQGGGSEPPPLFAYAWVDPGNGTDPGPPPAGNLWDQVNDPGRPYRTLQTAINGVYEYLVSQYNPPIGNLGIQGIVYALPGLYDGPFPIDMLDRVHVQGLGARRCVMRGSGPNPITRSVFWPNVSPCGTISQREVLVNYSFSHPRYPYPGLGMAPWEPSGNTAEMLDGFTFQGGDVQVLFHTLQGLTPFQLPVSGRVSNCVFDMRHDWLLVPGEPPVRVNGPWFGLMMTHPYQGDNNCTNTNGQFGGGYYDFDVLVANNTFIMAEYNPLGPTWENLARDGAVALIDVNNPNCGGFNTTGDFDRSLRGVGNPKILNNIFRTWTNGADTDRAQMAMLGIADSHTGANGVPTNAFHPNRAGTSSGPSPGSLSTSAPVVSSLLFANYAGLGDVYNCAGSCNYTGTPTPCVTATIPVPRVPLWDGSAMPMANEVDPGFVGEYLRGVIPGSTDYRDWRLLPDSASPMKDQGLKPPVTFANGRSYSEPADPQIWSFDRDGEEYGNPRVVDGLPDMGFDEIHLYVQAGSYGNDSNSHDAVGGLNPTAAAGRTTRYFLLPTQVATSGGPVFLVGSTMEVDGTLKPDPATDPLPAWTRPPKSLANGVTNPTLPLNYRTRYINLNNNGTPTPWSSVIGTAVTYSPPGFGLTTQVSLVFHRLSQVDDECGSPPCQHGYFNTMVQVLGSSSEPALWSNLQAEYR